MPTDSPENGTFKHVGFPQRRTSHLFGRGDVLRELVRMGVLDGNHIFPDCWVPSDRVLRFLQPLGLEQPDGGCTNLEKAHAIFKFLAAELNTGLPHLHRAFDIPLRHIDSSSDLRRRFGLEE